MTVYEVHVHVHVHVMVKILMQGILSYLLIITHFERKSDTILHN